MLKRYHKQFIKKYKASPEFKEELYSQLFVEEKQSLFTQLTNIFMKTSFLTSSAIGLVLAAGIGGYALLGSTPVDAGQLLQQAYTVPELSEGKTYSIIEETIINGRQVTTTHTTDAKSTLVVSKDANTGETLSSSYTEELDSYKVQKYQYSANGGMKPFSMVMYNPEEFYNTYSATAIESSEELQKDAEVLKGTDYAVYFGDPMIESILPMGDWNIFEVFPEAELLGKEEIRGKEAHKIFLAANELEYGSNIEQTFWIDVETGFLVRQKISGSALGGEDIDFVSDYTIAGIEAGELMSKEEWMSQYGTTDEDYPEWTINSLDVEYELLQQEYSTQE